MKRTVEVLAPVVATICNASLQTGFLPCSQKQARVTARLKKPSMNPDDLNSFRPISNLTSLSKIVERVVTKQFISHAAQNDLLTSRKSAYRQFHSTESAVLVVHNDIVCIIDQGHVVGLVLLDLSSTLDTSITPHSNCQFFRLDLPSLVSRSLAWFRSYLTDRAQVFTTQCSQTSHPRYHSLLVFPRVLAWALCCLSLIQRALLPFSMRTLLSIICLQMTHNMITVQYQRLRPW